MRDLSLGGPVNITNSVEGLDFFDDGFGKSGFSHHGGQVGAGEFFLSIDGELVDSHFVGLAGISVVFLDDSDILFEDESSEGFLFT